MIIIKGLKSDFGECPGVGKVACRSQATHRLIEYQVEGMVEIDFEGAYCERHAEQIAYRMNEEKKST